jgi:hypothetical protein
MKRTRNNQLNMRTHNHVQIYTNYITFHIYLLIVIFDIAKQQ